MIITCPADASHNSFETTAHVMESWEVDSSGEWISTIATLETTHGPDPDNIFTCNICGATADVAR